MRVLDPVVVRACVHAAGAVLVGVTALACSDARGTAPAGAGRYSPLTYELDEHTVRQVATVMRAWDPAGPPPETDNEAELAAAAFKSLSAGTDFMREIGDEFMKEGSTTRIEQIPELEAAIAQAGMTPRGFVEALFAYTNAMGALDMEGLEKLHGGRSDGESSGFKPAGVFKENVELVRRMNEEEELPSW